jgi:dihydrofolate reductase
MEWPYKGYKTYVVTGDPDLKTQSPDTFLLNGNLKSFILDLNQRTNMDTWLVGGGQLIKSFINEGLLDQMIISIIPKMIGEGIPLFVDKIAECDWKLEDTRAFNTGVVNLIYSKQ